MIPERSLPPRNASLIVTAGAEPEDVGVVDVDEDRDLRTAGLSSRPALAAQCRRILELGGLGDDLRSGVEEPLRLRRKRRHLAVRQQDRPQIDAPGADHAHRSERNRPRKSDPAQYRLYFLPLSLSLPQGHGSLRPTLGLSRSQGSDRGFRTAVDAPVGAYRSELKHRSLRVAPASTCRRFPSEFFAVSAFFGSSLTHRVHRKNWSGSFPPTRCASLPPYGQATR